MTSTIPRTVSRLGRRIVRLVAMGVAATTLGGCALAYLAGGVAQNFEYQKEIEVLAKYPELEGKRVAVVVDADLSILYQYPQLIEQITGGVTLRIGRDVPGVQVMRPEHVLAWQWRTPQWNAMAYGQIADALGVDRVIYIDLYEFRLNPPGNRWLWEGVCGANVGVIERDGFDPDMFADSYSVISTYPNIEGVDRTGASAGAIQTGLLAQFIKETAWLFHTHIEPKHPDKYKQQPK